MIPTPIYPAPENAGEEPAVIRHRVTPAPAISGIRGPLAGMQQRRTLAIVFVVEISGLLLVAASGSPAWQTLGLGIMFPAAGFLLAGRFMMFTACFVVMLLLAAGIVIGNFWLTLAVHVLLAITAALTVNDQALWYPACLLVPGLITTIGLAIHFALRRSQSRQAAHAVEVNRHLRKTRIEVVRSAPAMLGKELNRDDLDHLRFVLNRALQPVGEFQGFEFIDQFQTSGVRYQLTTAQLALAAYQYCHVPAFDGYAKEAQELLLAKMQNRRIWSYWYWENLWGNLRLNPDPIAFENVMYSGYYGTMIAAYMASTDDLSYNREGSIHLPWKEGVAYDYDFQTLSAILHRQHLQSLEHFIPCEPGWNYPVCNAFSFNTLLVSDRINGTRYWESVKPLAEQTMLREFITPDGRFLSARHRITGLGFPLPTLIANDGACGLTLHPSMPEIAERSWEILRFKYLKATQGKKMEFNTQGQCFDIGNYRFSELGTYVGALMSAREMGDHEAAGAIDAAILARYPVRFTHGENTFPEGSMMVRFSYVISRMLRAGAMYDLINVGNVGQWRDGPILSQAPYPAVLVARAVAQNGKLVLVLYPGEPQPQYKLVIRNLHPETAYSVICNGCLSQSLAPGATVRDILIRITGRTEVIITPVSIIILP